MQPPQSPNSGPGAQGPTPDPVPGFGPRGEVIVRAASPNFDAQGRPPWTQLAPSTIAARRQAEDDFYAGLDPNTGEVA